MSFLFRLLALPFISCPVPNGSGSLRWFRDGPATRLRMASFSGPADLSAMDQTALGKSKLNTEYSVRFLVLLI